jgi:uncharacterized membrane protein
VDLLRGPVMMLMALDHTREYFSELPFSPEDLSKTFGTLFFTRVITHFCASVFFLLAGAGAYLAVARGRSLPQVSHFFWTRGLWLVFLELTVLRFTWNFSFASVGLVQVIWALGWSMVAMALIVKLPVRWIAALGVVTIVFHNLLDAIDPALLGNFSGLWMALHSPGLVSITPGMSFFVAYPLIPWIGVMAAGYAMGALLDRNDRWKWILGLGVALTLAFFVLRAINLYGNGKASSSLTSVGGLVGLVVADVCVRGAQSLMSADLYRLQELHVDSNALLFIVVLIFISSILAGLLPAWNLSQVTLAPGLKDDDRAGTGGPRRHRLQSALLTAQVVLTCVLLIAAGLLIRSFYATQTVELGFNPNHVLVAGVNLTGFKYESDEAKIPVFWNELITRIRRIPGVTAAALNNFPPLSGE